MAEFRKVLMVVLPSGIPNLIPLETIVDCPIIVPDDKTTFVVHKKTIPGGSDGIDDQVISPKITEEDIQKIISKESICYIKVDYNNKLSTPTNGLGERLVVIFTEISTEVLV